MSNYLRSCLHCGNADTNMSTVPPKELYRIYGLLLSACCIKKESNYTLDTKQMSVVKKVSIIFNILDASQNLYEIGTVGSDKKLL